MWKNTKKVLFAVTGFLRLANTKPWDYTKTAYREAWGVSGYVDNPVDNL